MCWFHSNRCTYTNNLLRAVLSPAHSLCVPPLALPRVALRPQPRGAPGAGPAVSTHVPPRAAGAVTRDPRSNLRSGCGCGYRLFVLSCRGSLSRKAAARGFPQPRLRPANTWPRRAILAERHGRGLWAWNGRPQSSPRPPFASADHRPYPGLERRR